MDTLKIICKNNSSEKNFFFLFIEVTCCKWDKSLKK